MRASLTAVLSPISDTTAARLRPHGLNELVAISPGGSRAPETCSASRHTDEAEQLYWRAAETERRGWCSQHIEDGMSLGGKAC